MIHILLGTKAQLIKMAPIMRELQKRKIIYNFIFTGQHQQTITQSLNIFGLKNPDIYLYKGQDIIAPIPMFGWLIKIIYKAIKQRKTVFQGDTNGFVLLHGDTLSTLAGAIITRLLGLQCVHIESGLRSFNFCNPFPEELTRVLVTYLAHYYFCPNALALKNIISYPGKKINTYENTLLDSLNLAKQHIEKIKIDLPKSNYSIATIHRYENIFNKATLVKICSYLQRISVDIMVIFVLHPPTHKKLIEYDLYSTLESNPKINLVPRYDYFKFIKLVSKSEFVITDGGSNQEECAYLGKPCLLFRKYTERQEGIGSNAVLSQLKWEKIKTFIEQVSTYKIAIKTKTKNVRATDIIIDTLLN